LSDRLIVASSIRQRLGKGHAAQHHIALGFGVRSIGREGFPNLQSLTHFFDARALLADRNQFTADAIVAGGQIAFERSTMIGGLQLGHDAERAPKRCQRLSLLADRIQDVPGAIQRHHQIALRTITFGILGGCLFGNLQRGSIVGQRIGRFVQIELNRVAEDVTQGQVGKPEISPRLQIIGRCFRDARPQFVGAQCELQRVRQIAGILNGPCRLGERDSLVFLKILCGKPR